MLNKIFLPQILAVLVLSVLSYAYFMPLLEGKKMAQHDITQSLSMQGEINKYEKEQNRHILWTNAMFGGMPAYQIKMDYPSNLFTYFITAVKSIFIEEAHLMFFLLLGTYLAIYFWTGNIYVALISAIAFGFSSFNLIGIDAGHMSKVRCMGLMAPVFAGVIIAFQGRVFTGAALAGLFLAI